MHTIIKDKGLDDLEGLQIEIADDFEKVSCTGFLSKFKHFQLLAVITASYARVLLAVIRMGSGESRRKAFATCSSHLVVVGMYYGAAMFIFMRPASDRSPTQDKTVSAFYTILTPMLNPLIYSLRNKEVARAFRTVLGRGTSGE
ncbi:Olfactory receptor 2M3 [Manis javanica]|nr:Olfactory receptor 2M3 [Manis javanica]